MTVLFGLLVVGVCAVFGIVLAVDRWA